MNHSSVDDQEIGIAHEVKSPENYINLPRRQYWLRKPSFQINLKCFQKVATEFFKRFCLMEFSTD